MSGKIFLNYRRGDDPGAAGRLYDRLEPEFGPGQLFMDVEGHIRGGDDFVELLKAQVAQCDVFLAIIGPRWLEARDEQSRRRLDNPADWVRVELVSALDTGKRVIPVLVGGADIPRAEDLPDALRPLARRHAIRITLERFKADAQGLVNQIKAVLDDLARIRAAAKDAQSLAAADAERRRQEDEAARRVERERQSAEVARQQAALGRSPQEVARALELENWNFIKDKNDPAELRDHIARYSGGPTERFAAERLASLVWAGLGPDPGKATLVAFLDEFPKAREAQTAQVALNELAARESKAREAELLLTKETEAWLAVASSTDRRVIEAFLREWPTGAYTQSALDRMQELKGGRGRILAVAIGVAAIAISGTLYFSRGTVVPLPPPPKLTSSVVEAGFVTFDAAAVEKKDHHTKVQLRGPEVVKENGDTEYPLDQKCGSDPEGLSIARGAAIAHSLYNEALNSVDKAAIAARNPQKKYRWTWIRDQITEFISDNRSEVAGKLKVWTTAARSKALMSSDTKAFLRELISYKALYAKRSSGLNLEEQSPDAYEIAKALKDERGRVPCLNAELQYLVGSGDDLEYYGFAGNLHNFLYSFWYRRAQEGTTDLAENVIRMLLAR